jgi:hypothetical protein
MIDIENFDIIPADNHHLSGFPDNDCQNKASQAKAKAKAD